MKGPPMAARPVDDTGPRPGMGRQVPTEWRRNHRPGMG